MNLDVAKKVYKKFVYLYTRIQINNETFELPYSPEIIIPKLLNLTFLSGWKFKSTERDVLYPFGLLDIDAMIRDDAQEKYRAKKLELNEKKLEILSDIRRELIRANDKQELRSFVDTLVSERKDTGPLG